MFKVSCIQLRSNNDINHNLKKTEELIKIAVRQKTDLIITPEVSSLFSLEKKNLLKNLLNKKKYQFFLIIIKKI